MTISMTRTEELQSIFWDMYKDAHGIRPRHVDTTGWTEEQFAAEFAELELVIRKEELLRAFNEGQAIQRFENQIMQLITTGAKTREQAIAWMHDAEGTNGDPEFLCYTLGLPYRYFK
jgi:hypothetical protein